MNQITPYQLKKIIIVKKVYGIDIEKRGFSQRYRGVAQETGKAFIQRSGYKKILWGYSVKGGSFGDATKDER
jgi:hypothetical protein